MKFKCFFALVAFAAATAFAQQQRYSITPSNDFLIITFTNKYPFGVSTLEGRSDRRWVPVENFFATQLVGQVVLSLPVFYTTNTVFDPETSITTTNFTTNSLYAEFRLRHVSIAPGNAFKNLALVYGNLETVGGLGPVVPPGTNAWLPQYEGTNATAVPLSDPRGVIVDKDGNIYFTERDGHALSLIDTNGRFYTAIGPLASFLRRRPGGQPFELGAVASANIVLMRNPTGVYYSHSQDRIYVLDSGNNRVLRYTNGPAGPTNGYVSVLFDAATNALGQTVGSTNGAGLWVRSDELEAYYTDGKLLKRWEADEGVQIIPAPAFVDLSAVAVNSELDVFVTDRGGNTVWRVNNDGVRDLEAGNGFPFGRRIGEATFVSLNGPSSIWFLPVGGYLVGLDQGTSVWQVDAGDNAAKLVFGEPGVHDGDGEWFQKGRSDPKIGNVKSVTVAPSGDILMIENGYIRRINFLRHKP